MKNLINMKKNRILKIFILLFILYVFLEVLLANFYKQRLYKFDPILGWDLKKNLTDTKFIVKTTSKSYPVYFGNNIINNLCD